MKYGGTVNANYNIYFFGEGAGVNVGRLALYATNYNGAWMGYTLPVTLDWNTEYAISMVITEEKGYVYVNGVLKTEVTYSIPLTLKSNLYSIIGDMNNADSYYNSVRIYNKALTDEEVYSNYLVDKKRFNLQ